MTAGEGDAVLRRGVPKSFWAYRIFLQGPPFRGNWGSRSEEIGAPVYETKVNHVHLALVSSHLALVALV